MWLAKVLAHGLLRSSRRLTRDWRFLLASVGTLALGFAATDFLIVVVDSVWRRPLPYPNEQRLLAVDQLSGSDSAASRPDNRGLTQTQLRSWLSRSQALESGGLVQASPRIAAVKGPTGSQDTIVAFMSLGMFGTLGTAPALGRTVDRVSDLHGSVAVLSHGLWIVAFGGDRSAVGKSVAVDGRTYAVIGVMPAGFAYPSLSWSLTTDARMDDRGPGLWLPLPEPNVDDRSMAPTTVLMRPGRTVTEVLAEAKALVPPPTPVPEVNRAYRLAVRPLKAAILADAIKGLTILRVVVVCLAFTTLVTAVNLFVAREVRRRSELAIQVALGASRSTLLAEAFFDVLLVCGAAWLLGIGLASLATSMIRVLPGYVLPRVGEVAMSGWAFVAALICLLGTMLLVALTLALVRARRFREARASIGWRGAIDPRLARPAPYLVVLQVAVGLTLVTCSALLLQAAHTVTSFSTGIRSDGLWSVRLQLPPRFARGDERYLFFLTLAEHLRRVPGVVDVAAAGMEELFRDRRLGGPTIVREREPDTTLVGVSRVSEGFFTLVRTTISGRDFIAADRGTTATVAIVNRAFARHFFGSNQAVGEHVDFMGQTFRIVGVVSDFRDSSVTQRRPALFLPPDGAVSFPDFTVFIRTLPEVALGHRAMQQVISLADSGVTAGTITSYQALRDRQITGPHLYAAISSLLSVVCVVLAVIGVYTLLTLTIAARRHEFAIRQVCGATRWSICRLVATLGAAVTGLGIAVGLVASVIATHLIGTAFPSLETFNRAAWSMSVLFCVAALMTAVCIPALRAASITPAHGIREPT